jgi:hypothetical protein
MKKKETSLEAEKALPEKDQACPEKKKREDLR